MFDIDNTRKHFLPQSYQRGFSPDEHPNQVYVFDKQIPENGVQLQGIKNTAVSKDAYSIESDAILTDFESRFSQTFDLVRGSDVADLNEFISDRERSATLRVWLSRFVVDLCLRSSGFRDSPEMRAFLDAGFADARQHFNEIGSRLFVECSGDYDDDMLKRIVDALYKWCHLDDRDKWVAATFYPFIRGQEGGEWYSFYESGSWRFGEAAMGRTFITSDIPSRSLRLGPEPEFHDCVWFTVPLSSRLHLMGFLGEAWWSLGWSEGSRSKSGLASRLVEYGDREMDIANAAVFQNATRYVFASDKAELLRVAGRCQT